jgi:hypothetical protein
MHPIMPAYPPWSSTEKSPPPPLCNVTRNKPTVLISVTLRGQLRKLAGGLTSRAVLEKFAAIQMVDAHFPTSDGRELVFRRYTQPEKDQKILLAQLGWELPDQPPPRITSQGALEEPTA